MKYTQEQQKQGAILLEALVKKAWESPTFKDQLVADPTAAIKDFTGKDFAMPKGKKLIAEDQTNDSVIYLNIPSQPNIDELELSEEQLEQVSGGFTFTVTVIPIMDAVFCIGVGATIYAAVK